MLYCVPKVVCMANQQFGQLHKTINLSTTRSLPRKTQVRRTLKKKSGRQLFQFQWWAMIACISSWKYLQVQSLNRKLSIHVSWLHMCHFDEQDRFWAFFCVDGLVWFAIEFKIESTSIRISYLQKDLRLKMWNFWTNRLRYGLKTLDCFEGQSLLLKASGHIDKHFESLFDHLSACKKSLHVNMELCLDWSQGYRQSLA